MRVLKCTSCDLLLHNIPITDGHNAFCPQCGARVIKPSSLSMNGEFALCLASLILFFPAQYFALISIDLFGVDLYSTVTNGSWALRKSYPFVGALVIFSACVAPLLYLLSVLGAHSALKTNNKPILYYSTFLIKHLHHWVMIDIFLVSLAVACFKVTEVATVTIGQGLVSFILLQIFIAILLPRVSPKRFWQLYAEKNQLTYDLTLSQTQLASAKNNAELAADFLTCDLCKLTQARENTHCLRCEAKVTYRKPLSLQKTWALLISAIIFIFPANLYPISVIISNGRQLEDTIFSGVGLLVNQGMYGIALVIFTASIIVPVAKILCLIYLLMCIKLKINSGKKQRMKLYRFVSWIGKWSMMDLCVISLMVALLDRDNIVDFTPGPGAIAFGLVVVFTMFATENLDSRLIWDKYEQD